MATIYVDSNAAGTNAGTSWTNAYTSIASATGAAAGDVVLVEYRHTQTGLAANQNFSSGTAANPVRIVSVDKDNSDALRTGAAVEWTTTGVGPQGNIYAYGINWKQTGATLTLTSATDGFQTYESCTFTLTGSTSVTTAGSRVSQYWYNCTVDLSGASAAGVNLGISGVTWAGGSVICRSTQTALFGVNGAGGGCVIRGVLFSGTVTRLFDSTAAQWSNSRIQFVGCVAPTYTNVVSAQPNQLAAYDVSGLHPAGTITAAPLPPATYVVRGGTVASSLSRYRTGGADDGSQVNPYSWALVSGSIATRMAPLPAPPITRWVGTGSQTVTVYVAGGGSLNDDELWIEVLSPSEAGSATAQANFRTSCPSVLATPAALTTDSGSTWNGSGVGTKQKCTVTIAPTIAGPVTVRVFLAKASTTVYVDPRLDVA